MTERVDVLIDQASAVAAAVGDQTMFGRVYRALVEEREKVRSVQALVKGDDGEWIDGDEFGGLAGRIQALVAPLDRVESP